jgi:DNA-binding response OmpR family regulator
MKTTKSTPWILVVEDDVLINKAYAAKFSVEKITAEFATDGEEAIKKLDGEGVPALVLLDLMLPKKNGFEVLKEMKAHPKFKQIPVIILTNLGQDTDAKLGVELGATEYLVKTDIKIDEIITKIKKYLKL